MNTTAKAVIAVLAIAVVGLGIGLGVALASGDDDNGSSGSYWNAGSGDPYYGMMGAMGQGNWQGMQDCMRQVLGDDGYQRMLDHMRTDGCSWTYGDDDIDGWMHDMMYGMMYRMMNNGAAPSPGTTKSPGATYGSWCW